MIPPRVTASLLALIALAAVFGVAGWMVPVTRRREKR